jgi:hypothetical protein
MHATCFIISVAKQENNHTEGVFWIHHYIFDWNIETRRELSHPHHLLLGSKKPEGSMTHPDQGAFNVIPRRVSDRN